MIITTKSGSKYRIDLDAKTWARVRFSGESGYLRTAGGGYDYIRFEIGAPLEMLCPPITEGSSARYIETSDIVSVED